MLLRMALFFLNYPVRISQKSCRATFAVWLICLRSKKLSGAVVLLALGGTFAVCMGLSAMDYRNAGFTFTALDVGQGQCLIYTADGETSLVDCGGAQDESGELAARYLETNGVFCVDRLILMAGPSVAFAWPMPLKASRV